MYSTKILVLYEQISVTQLDFCSLIKKYVVSRNSELRMFRSQLVKRQDLYWSDVIIFLRSQNPLELKIIKWAKTNGRFCIIYWDDNLVDPPSGYILPKLRRNSMISTFQSADLVLCPNLKLAKRLAALIPNHRYAQINSIVEPENIIIPYRNDSSKIKILYAASKSREIDFEKIVKPAIIKLFHELGDVFSLTFIGVRPGFDDSETSIDLKYFDIMPLADYREHMSNVCYDIGLAPLINTEFSTYKYFNKFIDYSTYGVPGIYSNNEPYTTIVQNMINGLLSDNSADAWYQALMLMIKSPILREQCSSNAIKTIRENFSFTKICESIDKQIPELTSKCAQRKNCNSLLSMKTLYCLFKVFYLPFSYSMMEGPKKMFSRGKEHIKLLLLGK